jgi:hypothetical protein
MVKNTFLARKFWHHVRILIGVPYFESFAGSEGDFE